MIKGRMSLRGGRTGVLLGITDRNIERLRAGDPIRVDLGDIDPALSHVEVVIVTGADEGQITRDLIGVGLLDEATATRLLPGQPMQPGETRSIADPRA